MDSLVILWCVNARNYNRSFQEHYHFLFNMAIKFLGPIDRGATGTQKKYYCPRMHLRTGRNHFLIISVANLSLYTVIVQLYFTHNEIKSYERMTVSKMASFKVSGTYNWLTFNVLYHHNHQQLLCVAVIFPSNAGFVGEF